jgi:hypothetical protein
MEPIFEGLKVLPEQTGIAKATARRAESSFRRRQFVA